MAEFFEIVAKQDDLIKTYFERLQEQQDFYETEVHAAITIQRVFRGSLVRQRWHEVVQCSLTIQCYIRGMQARARAASIIFTKERAKNNLFFDCVASSIQKYWRGFWSRKYVHSFYARKAYLDKVRDDGEKTNQWLQDRHLRLMDEANEAKKAKDLGDFLEITSKLHHLVSTSQTPGIYNQPFASQVPTAFGEPVEKHIRDAHKHDAMIGSLKRPRNKTHLAPLQYPPYVTGNYPEVSRGKKSLASLQANVGRTAPVQGPFRNLQEQDERNERAARQHQSVQQSSKYNVVQEKLKMEDKLLKLTRIAPDDWHHRKPPMMRTVPTVQSDDKWNNRPCEFREDYNEISKMTTKPQFITSLKKDGMFWDFDPKEAQRGANYTRVKRMQEEEMKNWEMAQQSYQQMQSAKKDMRMEHAQ